MSFDSFVARAPVGARRPRSLPAAAQRLLARPELLVLLAGAAILNLWNLSINGWANTYYAAAVKSMSTSWHDFLFASMDKSGLMTVDKPPLALWIQALSVRIFGFNSLSILVPEALMGVAAVGLTYDLVRRKFGRFAGFVAGFALATTPVVVAVSRHNNPDELLVLCSVAALWCMVRALDTGRTRWLVICGACIGLGFETKMGVALMIVPAFAAAYMWVAPLGRLRAVRQLLAGGASLAVVGLAWPLLVTLTPAADRPWISGTSDNSIWSLIFGYNGLGRVAGQSGGPGAIGGGGPGGGGGGSLFGGSTGVFRLLQSGLGDQAGWLLGFALVAAVALAIVSRLRRNDPPTAWLIAVAGSLLVSASVFSYASGIFHPYYVSFLAPFVAALIGAGAGLMVAGGRTTRIAGPAMIAGGAITELVILNEISGQLSWAVPLVIGVAGGCAVALTLSLSSRTRRVVAGVAVAALMAAPATWAAETVGHATDGTFPTGGPVSASIGGPGGFSGPMRFPLTQGQSFAPPGGGGLQGSGGASGGFPGGSSFPGARAAGGFGGSGFLGAAGGGPGGFGGDSTSLSAVIRYADARGGGTIGVESQSSAAAEIVSNNADIAGLGGFSGRESSVTATWIAQKVASGHLRWIVVDNSAGGLPGDTRTGSKSAFSVVARACKTVTVTTSGGTKVTMYDCLGRAAAILRDARASGTA
jgi:4-amino-4-deoxy-L-arabinose transferase-like glycosyltransferase